jgi:hypothetical protein
MVFSLLKAAAIKMVLFLYSSQNFSRDYDRLMFKHCIFVLLFYFMIQEKKKIKPWLTRILIGGFILLLAGGGFYWWIATEKFADTGKTKAVYTVSVAGFIKEFQQNDSIANKKYSDKIVVVNGKVSGIEAADTTVNIKFIDPATGSYAIFAFQEQHLPEAKSVKEGDSISIKGSCSGGVYSEILGKEFISFKRCAINK